MGKSLTEKLKRYEGLCPHFEACAERVGLDSEYPVEDYVEHRAREAMDGRCAFDPVCRWSTPDCRRNVPYSPGIRHRTRGETNTSLSPHEYGYRKVAVNETNFD